MRYVADYVTYDMDYLKGTILDTIEFKKGVCHQYATLLALLLRAANIHAVPITTYKSTHKLTTVKIKTANDTNKKWYFCDTTFLDTFSHLPPSSKMQGENGNARANIWRYDQILNRTETNKSVLSARGESQFLGSILNNNLPWDKLNNHNYATQNAFYDRSIFNHIKQNNALEDNQITIESASSASGSSPSRFFFHNGNWYTISRYQKKWFYTYGVVQI